MRSAGTVGLDTEFMRERTYWPRLCLVQLATEDEVAVVDPLAIDDLTALKDLLSDPDVVKVVHGASQDAEVLLRGVGAVPSPVFDTQLAATLAGFATQTGYAALVKDLLDVTVHKGEAYTDWARRPLSERQVTYAAEDARWLPGMYRILEEQLRSGGRLEWLAADFARLAEPSTYVAVPEEQWKRVKRASTLNRRALAVLKEAAAWREREAQRADRPRKWVLSDEALIEVARRAPRDAKSIVALRGVGDRLSRGGAEALVRAIEAGLAVPDDALPSVERRRRGVKDVAGGADLMSALVRVRAREHGIAPSLLASRDDLEGLAAGEREGLAVLEGWRRTLIGEELVDLLDGRLSLSLGSAAWSSLAILSETVGFVHVPVRVEPLQRVPARTA